MSDRPTPETDKYAKADWWTLFRATEHGRILERERDEAREAFVIATDQMVVAQCKLREANKERDEAREALMKIEDLFLDCTDIYADSEKMGLIARAALEETK